MSRNVRKHFCQMINDPKFIQTFYFMLDNFHTNSVDLRPLGQVYQIKFTPWHFSFQLQYHFYDGDDVEGKSDIRLGKGGGIRSEVIKTCASYPNYRSQIYSASLFKTTTSLRSLSRYFHIPSNYHLQTSIR